MRVLLVTNVFPPDFQGGYDVLAGGVVDHLRARGHDVQVLTTGDRRSGDPRWVHRDLELVRPFGQPAGLERIAHVRAASVQARLARAFVAREQPDVAIMMSLRRLGLHVPRELERQGIPIIWLFNDDWLLAHHPAPSRGEWRRTLSRLLERGRLAARTWRGCSFRSVLAPSEHVLATLRRGGAPISGGHVCDQGVDLTRFSFRGERAAGPGTRLLFVGRLHATKACDVALHALAVLRRDGLDASLTVAGDGPDAARLHALAARLDLQGAVRWLGAVPHHRLPSTYADHDVFVFPSGWEEPAGLTFLEAMAVGVPVVAQATGGAKERLRDGDNALLVEDAASMARAITRLVEAPTLARALVNAGRAEAARGGGLAGYVDAIEDLARAAARVPASPSPA